MRKDIALQLSVEKENKLASSSSLCRFEKKFERKLAVDIHKEIINQFIRSFKQKPKKLVLAFDATDLSI